MPYTTPSPGDTISVAYATANIRDQVVTPFASAAARSSAILSPVQGMLSHQADGKYFVGYDGVSWVPAGRYSQIAHKTADKSLTTTTALEADNHLTAPLAASGVYRWGLWLNYLAPTTGDLKIDWTVPAGTTMRWGGIAPDTAGALTIPGNLTESSVVNIGGSGTDFHCFFSGRTTVSSTAGNQVLRWAQVAASGTTTVYQGSILAIERIS